MDQTKYTKCKYCDHFVEPNAKQEPSEADFIHLEDGEQEFNHEAKPSDQTHTLNEWRHMQPTLFQKHIDGAIGPNSSYHDRRGKI